MTVRIEMNGDAATFEADLSTGLEKLFTEHLGPDILADQQRFVPVDTGRLLASLGMDIDRTGDLELHVGSILDDVPYALATEYGFHGIEHVRAYETRAGRHVAEHDRQGNTPEQPYLRPSIYQVRAP